MKVYVFQGDAADLLHARNGDVECLFEARPRAFVFGQSGEGLARLNEVLFLISYKARDVRMDIPGKKEPLVMFGLTRGEIEMMYPMIQKLIQDGRITPPNVPLGHDITDVVIRSGSDSPTTYEIYPFDKDW